MGSDSPVELNRFPDTSEMANERWSAAKAIITAQTLASHHLDSFNAFVEEIPRLMVEGFPIKVDSGRKKGHTIFIDNIQVERPMYEKNGKTVRLLPCTARLCGYTYESKIYADVRILYDDEKNPPLSENRVLVATIPVMVGSKLCHLQDFSNLLDAGECEDDAGGYFIIMGSEYFMTMKERLSNNRIMVYKATKDEDKKKFFCTAECRSEVPEYTHACFTKLYVDPRKMNYTAEIGYHLTKKIHILVLFKCILAYTFYEKDISVYNDHEFNELAEEYIYSAIIKGNTGHRQLCRIAKTMISSGKNYNVEETITDCISAKVKNEDIKTTIKNIFGEIVFAHVRTKPNRVFYLAEMFRRIVYTYLGDNYEAYPEIRPSDRDSYTNKRVDSSGFMYRELFIAAQVQYRRELQKKSATIRDMTRASSFGTIFIRAFRTGNWTAISSKIGFGRTGVADMYNRSNSVGSRAYLRKVGSGSSETKVAEAHYIHPTQYGKLDLCETPEDADCGLTNFLALLAQVTYTTPSIKMLLTETAEKKSGEPIDISEWQSSTPVFYNGELVFTVSDPDEFVRTLVNLRHNGAIHHHMSVYYDKVLQIIEVETSEGRLTRPLYRAENGKVLALEDRELKEKYLKKNITDAEYIKLHQLMLTRNYIEYIDSNEEQGTLIAFYPSDVTQKHTHCEIVHSAVLGVCSGIIPLPHCAPSPRNCYISSMMKQAMGAQHANYHNRFDTSYHYMHFPQVPLSRTRMYDIMRIDRSPIGQNVIFAITMHDGDNQEDSTAMDKFSIDNGMGTITSTSTVRETESGRVQQDFIQGAGKSTNSTRFGLPPDEFILKHTKWNFAYLDERGIIQEGAEVESGTVLYTMCSVQDSKVSYHQYTFKKDEKCVVEKVQLITNPDGHRSLRIKLRSVRVPQIADKFATIHGQKGTISRIIPSEDMPRFEDGTRPQLIFNPAGLPTRMTINKIQELIGNTNNMFKGDITDAEVTAFEKFDLKGMLEFFKRTGHSQFCERTMYSGTTGKRMKALVYCGPVYYIRLHHMIADKISVRDTGEKNSYTRQPAHAGRSHGYALTSSKIGTMEKDAIGGHGASAMLLDRLLYNSDAYKAPVCESCGAFANGTVCCGKVCMVSIPYILKLMHQEMMASGFQLKLRV